MKKTRKRNIYYKKALLASKTTKTLQEILQTDIFAGDDKLDPNLREEQLSTDSDRKRLVNHYSKREGMFFGQLIAYSEGASQSFLTKSTGKSFYEIKAIQADEIDSAAEQKNEFIESILYFGVYKNHLVVMQSLSLTMKALEAHLSWLLHDYKSILAPDEQIILQDRPTQQAKNQIETVGARQIKVGSPLAFTQESSQEETDQPKHISWSPKTLGADLVKSLLGQKDWDDLDIKHSLDDQNISVQLIIRYRRKTGDSGQKILDDIATSLRHQDEEDYKIELKDGSILEGSELKISTKIDVSFMPDGRVAEADLYSEMAKWLIAHYRNKNIVD